MNGSRNMPQMIWLDSATSTNAVVRSMAAVLSDGSAVCAVEQTAGRGQRGNSWESEPGSNVTMSMMLRPGHIRAADQFCLSMAVSLAVARSIATLLGGEYGRRVRIKWPNDIYVDDRKICGILIENSLSGPLIASSIVGIGLNVNQRVFVSDAPNPVSMALIDGQIRDVRRVADLLAETIREEVARCDSGNGYDTILDEYMMHLWRGEGYHRYVDVASGDHFDAKIAGVGYDGILSLVDAEGLTRTYAFKEVMFRL